MAQGKWGSPYWIAATAGLSAAAIVELAVLAIILRLRDPDYLRMPVTAFLLPAALGLTLAVILKGSSSAVARGTARGVLTVSVMITIAGLQAGLLYRGGWI